MKGVCPELKSTTMFNARLINRFKVAHEHFVCAFCLKQEQIFKLKIKTISQVTREKSRERLNLDTHVAFTSAAVFDFPVPNSGALSRPT